MAKKRSKTTKLPKTIGGVKIPKQVRKSGGELLAKVNSPLGRELLAAGLVAAGAALAKKDAVRGATGEAMTGAVDAQEVGARMAAQIGGVVGAAANAALDRIFGAAGDGVDRGDATGAARH
ncbi:hypothetical protein EAH87_06730 [Sphingomonas koreensis]|nr:hypothetical protein EAH87_06730 [Sphingomonas koreensis]